MTPAYKPDGYSSVSPYLIVDAAAPLLEFLTATFDAEPRRRYERDDGSVMHAEVQIDDSIVMIGEGGEEYPTTSSTIHVYVPDVDATYRRALDAGGEAVDDPTDREDDPDRRGSVKGPAGNIWSIATMTATE